MNHTPLTSAPPEDDDPWVSFRIKLRTSTLERLKSQARAESKARHRRVYVSDLIRDGARVVQQAWEAQQGRGRKTPATKAPAFVPSKLS